MHPASPQPTAPLPRIAFARGAYAGWWVAGAVALVGFSRVAFFNPVLGVFIDPLQQEFDWSRAEIAGALSLGTLIAGLAAPFIGHWIDRWGSRWFMAGTVAALVLLLLLLASMETLWQFYALFGAGRALVTAILDIAIVVTVSNWFIRHRGRATGLTMVGTRAGMAVMPLVVLLFLSVADWRAAFAALGLLLLVVAVLPPYLLVRRRPEDLGLTPDGDRRPPARHAGDDAASDPRWTVRQVLRTRAFWFLLAGMCSLYFVGGATNLAMASHLQDNGLSQATAITVVTVWAVVGIGGGMAGGELRERLGVRFALPLVMLLTTGSLTILLTVENVWMAYLFAITHGLAFGAQLPLMQIALADYFGRWSVGAVRGVSAPALWGINAAGPVTAGVVFDARGSYDLLFVAFIGVMLLGAAVLLLAGRPPSPPQTAREAAARRA